MKKKYEEKKPTIKMDSEGYDQLISEIASLRKRLTEVCREKPDGSSIGDWADTAIGEGYIIRDQEANNLRYELEQRIAKLPYIEIVQKLNNDDLVDVNDVIRVSYGLEDDCQDVIVRLVGKMPDIGAEINQVSINSPMGKAIYGKPVGSTNTYRVGNNTFQVTIEEKLNKKLTR